MRLAEVAVKLGQLQDEVGGLKTVLQPAARTLCHKDEKGVAVLLALVTKLEAAVKA